MSKKNDKVVCMFGVPHSVEVAKLGRYGHVQKVYVAGTHYENTKDVTLKLYNEELLWHLQGWCRQVVKRSERAEVEKKRYKVVMLQVVQRVGAPELTEEDVEMLKTLYRPKRIELLLDVTPLGEPREGSCELQVLARARDIHRGGGLNDSEEGGKLPGTTIRRREVRDLLGQCSPKKKNYRRCMWHAGRGRGCAPHHRRHR
eukprot:TRINITY_DN627_c0_g2_i2.p2 TRINITY_DN627_c0_g2~~TRINITY_DN627_c0_g2_i2.p2  ORF type:complete len:201 (+),score=40.18 TRINITY_DN627_c0_g2_i2:39-641(+)